MYIWVYAYGDLFVWELDEEYACQVLAHRFPDEIYFFGGAEPTPLED